MQFPTFKPVADHALLIEFGTQVDDALNRRVVALDKTISQAKIIVVVELVPALVNLLIVFDPVKTTHKDLETAVRDLFPLKEAEEADAKVHRVPICYDTELCPDLAVVAKTVGLSIEAVIAEHAASELRVSMYGFAPGFAYLSGIPKTIQVPRKPSATRGIPTGQVMIAGPQCLVTTVVMPTGWSIIGRTALKVIQDDPDNPFLFNVGDTVAFDRVRRQDLPAEMQMP
jgi:inhibitor of KinA